MRRAEALLRELEDLLKGKKRHDPGATWTRGDGSEWRYGADGRPERVRKEGRGAAPAPKPKGKKAAAPVDDTKLVKDYAARLHDDRLEDIHEYESAMRELASDRRMKQPQMLALARALGHRGASSTSRKVLLERIAQRLEFYKDSAAKADAMRHFSTA